MFRKSLPSYLHNTAVSQWREREQVLLFIETERDVSDPSVGDIFALGSDVETTGTNQHRVRGARPLGVDVVGRGLSLDGRGSWGRGLGKNRMEESIEEGDSEIGGPGAQRGVISPSDAHNPLSSLSSELSVACECDSSQGGKERKGKSCTGKLTGHRCCRDQLQSSHRGSHRDPWVGDSSTQPTRSQGTSGRDTEGGSSSAS
jgi:hypothetical protein